MNAALRDPRDPRRWLPWACVAMVLLAAAKVPALDEESYLWLGRMLDPTDPYGWSRAWPPWDATNGFVYAHPPLFLLWMRALAPLQASLPALRIVAGAPFAWLLGWSVARLAAVTTHHPARASLAWLGSSIVVLGLQDSLMIDLPAVALLTAGVALWREALGAPDEVGLLRGARLGGLALGLAVCTKYSMAVVLPVLALHAVRLRSRPGVLRAGVELVLVVAGLGVAMEAVLAASYGGVHVWEVWSRRDEIPRGPMASRALGTLVRGALLPSAAVVLLARPALGAVGAGIGVAASIAVGEQLSPAQAALLVTCSGLGGVLLARAVEAVLRGVARRRKGDRDDAWLLGGWLLAVVGGVVVAHNFASARYLLPAAVPAAILVARSAEEVRHGKAVLAWTSALGGALALALALADARFSAAGSEVARLAQTRIAAMDEAPAGASTTSAAAADVAPVTAPLREAAPVRFSGEWSFRHAMESSGAQRLRPGERLAPCQWWVGVDSTGRGEVPENGDPVARIESADSFPLRVVDATSRAGLYADTLGPLPFAWDAGPRRSIEAATVRRGMPCPNP